MPEDFFFLKLFSDDAIAKRPRWRSHPVLLAQRNREATPKE
ncbi:MAG TPA: hypothetical protein V6D15_07230 [Oculatellaceae cyanobacterium]